MSICDSRMACEGVNLANSLRIHGNEGTCDPVCDSLALFTQRPRVIAAANSLQFFVHTEPSSYSVKLLQYVNSYSKPLLRIPKRSDGTHHDVDYLCVIFNVIPRRPPVNLNMYPQLLIIIWMQL